MERYIRVAAPEDAEELLAIYAPYVTDTAITFEYEVPGVDEFRARIADTIRKYPYLVAVEDDEIVGYAYTGPFGKRIAYDWAVETSIYLRQDRRGAGLGRMLYNALEQVSHAQNICNLNACIGYPQTEDSHLTRNSAAFHAHLGYKLVGEFHQCGYKFGCWYDMIWMEKLPWGHPENPDAVIPFPALTAETLASCGVAANQTK